MEDNENRNPRDCIYAAERVEDDNIPLALYRCILKDFLTNSDICLKCKDYRKF